MKTSLRLDTQKSSTRIHLKFKMRLYVNLVVSKSSKKDVFYCGLTFHTINGQMIVVLKKTYAKFFNGPFFYFNSSAFAVT